jgi:hypothetical protein
MKESGLKEITDKIHELQTQTDNIYPNAVRYEQQNRLQNQSYTAKTPKFHLH